MRLADLADQLGVPLPSVSTGTGLGHSGDADVNYVTHQADWVQPGDAFVAIVGARFDGHSFIVDAVARGAVAVLGQGLPSGIDCPVPYLVVSDARAALADAAAALAGHPSASMTVIGVTGTDGKTTTSCLARHLARITGRRTGLLSTIGYELGDGVLRQPPSHFTTPESPQVQEILAEMQRDGVEVVVVETSSHALALDRVRGVDYDIAVWTNLSAEHLDFHGSMQGYFEHKALLVERARHAVLNAEDPWTEQLVDRTEHPLLYAAEPNKHVTGPPGTTKPPSAGIAIWAGDVVEGPDDLRFTVHTAPEVGSDGNAVGATAVGKTYEAVLPMIGRFNVANAVAAIAACSLAGGDAGQLVRALASFDGVPGRMEMADRQSGQPRVIVDFAHTPPSVEKALETVRVTTHGRLWVVLGSAGGPRDPGKRAPLGAAASAGADHVVFTEEDHRDTPIADILAEMERGAREAGRSNFVSIPDRVEAIRYAVSSAAADDTVVLAGKGPEATLERDTETIAWDEMGEAVAALTGRDFADTGDSPSGQQEEVRMSSTVTASADRGQGLLQRYVDSGDIPGAVAVVGDLGAEPDLVAVGRRATGATAINDTTMNDAPMDGTEIMRIQSMTKAITSVAALRLVDRGVVALDDDVAQWLPELTELRVLRTATSSLDNTVAAERAITVRHLLTNTSGYGMVLQECALQRAMAENATEAGVLPDGTGASQWLSRMADLPLAFQPGQGWRYHHSFGMLGILISRLAGCSLHDHLVADLFEPLAMCDTGMWVSRDKRERLTAGYRHGDEHLVEIEPAGGGPYAGVPPVDVSHGELVSTVGDYWRFLRALAANVVVDGEPLLSTKHHHAMLSDQVPARLKTAESFFPGFWEGMGWGFGVAVETDGPRRGRYGWSGGLGTDFFVNPDGSAGILFTQVELGERTMPMLKAWSEISG